MSDLSKLAPSSVTVARAFEVDEQDISWSATVSRTSVAFTVGVNHPSRPSLVEIVHDAMVPYTDRADCPVYGLQLTKCGLDPKIPPCHGCRLAPSYNP